MERRSPVMAQQKLQRRLQAAKVSKESSKAFRYLADISCVGATRSEHLSHRRFPTINLGMFHVNRTSRADQAHLERIID